MKKLIGLLLILSMSLNVFGVKQYAMHKAALCGVYLPANKKFIKSGVLIDQLHQFAQKALEDKKVPQSVIRRNILDTQVEVGALSMAEIAEDMNASTLQKSDGSSYNEFDALESVFEAAYGRDMDLR